MSSTEVYEKFYTETYEGDYGWVDDEDSALDDGLEEYPHVTLEDEDYSDSVYDAVADWDEFEERGYDLD